MPTVDETYIRKSQRTKYDVSHLFLTDLEYIMSEVNDTILAFTGDGDITIYLENYYIDGKTVQIKNMGSGKVYIKTKVDHALVYTLNTPQSRVELQFTKGHWYYF